MPTGAAAAEAGAAAAVVGAAEGAGILMVGAEVGFGGRLIRTVSFFGCIFAASAGLGGKESAGATEGAGVGVSGAAGGRFGLFSAINVGIPKNGQEDPLCQSGFLRNEMMFGGASAKLLVAAGNKTRWRRDKSPPVTVWGRSMYFNNARGGDCRNRLHDVRGSHHCGGGVPHGVLRC